MLRLTFIEWLVIVIVALIFFLYMPYFAATAFGLAALCYGACQLYSLWKYGGSNKNRY